MDAPVTVVAARLESIVNLHVTVPRQHPSAALLGTERMGSGVVIDGEGHILTANYVVMGAQSVQVTPVRGRRLRAELAAQDFDVGLALLRVKRTGLRAAPLEEEELERGQRVFALGATGPTERRVSDGVVTDLGEFEAYWEYLLERAIVSSAANPGFGGGGLFSTRGRLVGIVSLNLAEIARNSLSIPVDCYRRHADELRRFGRVVSRPRRAWLGVFAHALEEGIVVAGLVPDGPAARAGVQEGDLIVRVNAAEVESRRDLYLRLWECEPGQALTLEVLRDNMLRRLQLTGGDRAEFFRQR